MSTEFQMVIALVMWIVDCADAAMDRSCRCDWIAGLRIVADCKCASTMPSWIAPANGDHRSLNRPSIVGAAISDRSRQGPPANRDVAGAAMLLGVMYLEGDGVGCAELFRGGVVLAARGSVVFSLAKPRQGVSLPHH